MIRHVLCRFERTAVLEEDRYSRAPERVITDRIGQPRDGAPSFDNPQHVTPGERQAGEPVILIQRLKQRRSALTDRRRFQVGIQILLRFVMQPDKLLLVSLFEEPAAVLAYLAACNRRV